MKKDAGPVCSTQAISMVNIVPFGQKTAGHRRRVSGFVIQLLTVDLHPMEDPRSGLVV